MDRTWLGMGTACAIAALALLGCSSADEAPASTTGGTGGSVSTGGAPETGGSVATGGTVATGGAIETGGSVSTGGTVATGGAIETGGSVATGGSSGSALRVAFVSDLNGSYGSTTYGSTVHAAVAYLVANPPDVVITTGDMVAGQQAGLDYPAMWAGFHTAVTDPLTAAGIPFAVTAGNHDASGYSEYAGERAEFESQWQSHAPSVTFVDRTSYPFYYAFSVGRVLFVALYATVVGGLASEQRTWLDGLLAAQGASYDATVVFGHLSLYPVSVGRETEILGDSALESILEARGVTLYASGHSHAYYAGRRGSVRHVAVGCLGNDPRPLVGDTVDSAQSLVIVTIDGGSITGLDAYPAPGFAAPIPRSALPPALGTDARAYTRDDL